MRRTLLVVCVLAVAAPAAAGTITGVVLYKGTKVPEREKLRRDSDPYCDKTEALSDDVIVTKDKLAGVVVRIKVGTGGTHAAPTDPVELTQDRCMYRPHVQTAFPGQKLAVKNADATYHNVHAWLAGKTLWNDGHPAEAADIVKESVGAAGDVLELKCDVHPWMHAYVVVVDHPYVDVTGTDGAFRITGVPPGTYTLEAWHPTLGLQTTSITIKAKSKKAVKAKFAFIPPLDDIE
jgi:plastocyanin